MEREALSITCGRGGLPASPRAPRRPGGRSPGAAAPARCAFPGSSCRRRRRSRRSRRRRRRRSAPSAFGSRIRNPCAWLTMKQSSNVPAFLSKLWTLVEEAHTNEFITWSQVRGRGFRAPPPPRVLPPRGTGRAAPRRAGLGWARPAAAAAAAARGLPVPPSLPPSSPLTHADPPALCEPRAGPGPAGRLRSPRAAVGEGRPGNGPAGRPGPVRCGAVLVRSFARSLGTGPAAPRVLHTHPPPSARCCGRGGHSPGAGGREGAGLRGGNHLRGD